jgi:hypothetical protein
MIADGTTHGAADAEHFAPVPHSPGERFLGRSYEVRVVGHGLTIVGAERQGRLIVPPSATDAGGRPKV